MTTLQQPMPTLNQIPNLVKSPIVRQRIKALDSLRGLAALTVVLAHTLGGFTATRAFHFTPLYIIRTAHEAVIFFFLLSGYVLVYQYRQNPAYTYRHFLLQRFCRIYLPYAGAIALSIGLMLCCKPSPINADFISGMWHTPLSGKELAKHIILIDNFNTNTLNPVIWSLVHEMRIALLFPLLLWLVNLNLRRSLVVTGIIMITGIVITALNLTYSLGYNTSYGYTIYYFYMFAVGGLLARYSPQLTQRLGSLGAKTKTILLITALLLYNYASLVGFVFDHIQLAPTVNQSISDGIADFIVIITSSYFIIMAVGANDAPNMLTSRPLLFLGKISYSLYLVHLPVVAFAYFTLYGKAPSYMAIATSLLITLFIATIFNRYIEQPAMRLAKKENHCTVLLKTRSGHESSLR